MTIGELIAEPLEIFACCSSLNERRSRVRELLGMVGVSVSSERSYPHELSGGQKQRVAMARALAPGPRFLIADEPVASLDISLRGQILNLLMELRHRFGLTILLIAHDLAMIERVADRVAVMYAGRLVELAGARRFYETPQHPYSNLLLELASGSGATASVVSGEPPDPSNPPQGCRFEARCSIAGERCAATYPPLEEVQSGHSVSCYYPGEMTTNSGNRQADESGLIPTEAIK
jgi:oligopeptide/dipeptide ABC transporter ATP-binding protein